MTIKIKTKWEPAELNVEIAQGTKKLLISIGEALQNEFSANAPFATGLLANSMNYQTTTKTGKFGSQGETTPSQDDLVSKPTKLNSVRAGSAVEYAAAVEKKQGKMVKSFDAFVASRIIDFLLKKSYEV